MASTFGPCGEIIVQSGGGEVVDSISVGNSIAASTSGELFNIPVVSTKRIIITGLMPQNGNEGNIEIKFGSRVIYSGDITDAVSTSSLTISAGYPNTTGNEYTGTATVNEIKGDFGEDLIITKTSGSTAVVIWLSYKVTF